MKTPDKITPDPCGQCPYCNCTNIVWFARTPGMCRNCGATYFSAAWRPWNAETHDTPRNNCTDPRCKHTPELASPSTVCDKNLHRDEFRLRLLVTNGCNKTCHFCLNDFQPKTPVQFLSLTAAKRIIRAYTEIMLSMGKPALISLSGGEPETHPEITTLARMARVGSDDLNKYEKRPFVMMNTNGLALRNSWLYDLVDCWRVGVTDIVPEPLVAAIKAVGATVQYVITPTALTDTAVDAQTDNTIRFYVEQGVPVKLFADFNAKDTLFYTRFYNYVEGLMHEFPNTGTVKSPISTRYTGRQENRGAACKGCNRKCVTLKALWVFPNGTASTCPQNVYTPWNIAETSDKDLYDIVLAAYTAHTKGA